MSFAPASIPTEINRTGALPAVSANVKTAYGFSAIGCRRTASRLDGAFGECSPVNVA
jgi:hypothetical protein